MRRSRPRLPTVCAAAAIALSGCGGDTTNETDSTTEEAEGVEIADAWIKAVPEEDEMTGVFGVLDNTADQEATVVGAHADDVASLVELHEVATGDDGNTEMQEKSGGFPLDAAATHELKPGGDHIMLMELITDLEPGDEVDVELEFADGSTHAFAAPVKDFEGANEDYQGGDDGEETEH